MELSEEVQDLLQRFRMLSKKSEDSMRVLSRDYEVSYGDTDIVDVNCMDFSDEETW